MIYKYLPRLSLNQVSRVFSVAYRVFFTALNQLCKQVFEAGMCWITIYAAGFQWTVLLPDSIMRPRHIHVLLVTDKRSITTELESRSNYGLPMEDNE